MSIINDEQLGYLIHLYSDTELTWKDMTKAFNKKFPEKRWEIDNLRNRIRTRIKNGKLVGRGNTSGRKPDNPESRIKRTVKYNGDGSKKYVDLEANLKLKARVNKSPEDIMRLKNYNPAEWRVIDVTDNDWSMTNGNGERYWNYQCKIRIAPKSNEIDYDELIDKINQRAKPYEYQGELQTGETYLAIPLFDMHFGNAKFDDYKDSLAKTLQITIKGYSKILIVLGGDLLHNDNHRGTTSSGTVIDKVDMSKAWEQALDYIDAILGQAIKYSKHVEVNYVPGNHDEITGQTIIKTLSRLYANNPTVSFDTRHQMFKATLLGHNFIGMTHGDRSQWKKYHAKFSIKFAKLWGADGVITRECFTGHLHHEAYKDIDGFMIRQASTRTPIDSYHEDNAFDMSHKRFELIEYDEYEPIGVYYV